MPTCKNCNVDFEITDEDRQFYKKIDVPEPSLCPNCRMQRRMVWRNERKLYQRKCDITGKTIFSTYSPDSQVKVCDKDHWFTDKFDGQDFGRDYNFNRPFFEQFMELTREVPFPSLRVERSENSDYNIDASDCSNCYLCSRTHQSQDMLYTYRGNSSSSCVDCYQAVKSELLYECVECVSCYNCKYLFFCDNCNDCSFSIDCRNCSDCFMCTNLRKKKYCFMNKQLSKEEYKKKLSEFDFNSYLHVQKAFKLFKDVKAKAIHRDLVMVNAENCVGDNIFDSKNCYMCFAIKFCHDCRYLWDVMRYKDSADAYTGGRNSELIYETTSVSKSYNVKFCVSVKASNDTYYSIYCQDSNDLFGCMGLKRKKYCILNKQYSEEEYKALLPKIIEHMKKTGEWGEFFPITLSPYAYNETTASQYFPIEKEEVESAGWRWKDEKMEIPDVEKIIPAEKLPDNIKEIPDDVLNWAIKCEITKHPFKITPQELRFYRDNHLPLPRLHPDERYRRRLEFKRPNQLFDRKCMKCDKAIKTPYSPDWPESVYCESCYLETVY